MKRLIILILILCLLVGCSVQISINESQTNETSEKIDVETNDNLESDSEDNKNSGSIGNKNSLDNDIVAEVFSKVLYPEIGEEVEIKFKVSNEGLYDVEGFDYRILISKSGNSVYEYKNKTNNINKGDSLTIKTLNWEFESFGNYKVELFLDELNTIKELEEENNIDSVTIYVKDQTSSSSSNDDDDKKEIADTKGCSDSDGGKDYKELGTCVDENFVNGKKDFCAGDEMLGEMFCSPSGLCDIDMKECDGVCRNGICIG